jgi:hypothetical protein
VCSGRRLTYTLVSRRSSATARGDDDDDDDDKEVMSDRVCSRGEKTFNINIS